jgi:hypothetical protein
VLLRAQVSTVPASQQAIGTLYYYAKAAGIDHKDVVAMQKLRCLLQIMHYMRHGRSMIQYEQWYQNEVELGIFNPAGIRMSSDDIGWQAATLLYMFVMEHLRRFAAESPWLGAAFDDSDNVKKQEFMCTFIFGLNAGRREAHLLRMHQLATKRCSKSREH